VTWLPNRWAAINATWPPFNAPLFLQEEQHNRNRPRPLIGLLDALFATSSHVKRLKVSTVKFVEHYVHMPNKILSMISMVSSLEYLTVDIPKHRSLERLTGSIYSLRKLKVQSLALQRSAFAVYGCRWQLHIKACRHTSARGCVGWKWTCAQPAYMFRCS
jgi:hypothetical protein